jgi:hypothetical protein
LPGAASSIHHSTCSRHTGSWHFAKEDKLALKPTNLTLAQAAVVPILAGTAL